MANHGEGPPILPRLALGLLLALLLGGTLLLWARERAEQQKLTSLRFDGAVAHVREELRGLLRYYVTPLYAARAFVLGSEQVDADRWAGFVAGLHLDDTFPAVDGIALVTPVATDRLAGFVAAHAPAITRVFPDTGTHHERFVITHIGPLPRTASALGYDTGTDPVRRAAAEAARDGARPVMSGPLHRVTPQATALDLLYFLPVYRTGTAPASVAGRRTALTGWITTGYHAEKLFRDLHGVGDGLHIRIRDGGMAGAVLWDSAPESVWRSALRDRFETDISGRRWLVEVGSLETFEQSAAAWDAYAILLIGLTLSLAGWGAARRLQAARADALLAAREASQALDESEERLAAAFFDATSEAIVITDAQQRILAVNAAFTRITGYTAEEAIGQKPSLLKSGYHDAAFYAELFASLAQNGFWRGEIWDRRKDGEVFPQWQSIVAVHDSGGAVAHYMAMFSDISQRKSDEYKIWRQANYDMLTGLPNRVLFMDRLGQGLRAAQREGQMLALMFVDLDRFKWVNDTLGHSVGDRLLQQAAARLQGSVREADTVARLGGDEFTVIVGDLHSETAVERLAEAIIARMNQPFVINGHELFVSASIGISLFPRDGDSADVLVRNADNAMYRSKERGRDGFHFFTQEMNDRAQRNLLLQSDLRQALQRNEFVVYYQPVVDLAGGGIVGAEALVRWQHPERGLLMPDQFIALAEETALITSIDQRVMRVACEDAAGWQRQGYDLFVSTNVSSLEWRTRECHEAVGTVLAEVQLPAHRLKLEITERLMMEDTDRTRQRLQALRDLGVHLAVDDFGTGYSSLSYLKRFPLDYLKIDRLFIAGLPDDHDSVALVQAMVGMARSLGLTVIAEGVETAAQADFLRDLGCALAQGFLYGRPVPKAEFEALLSG